MSPPISLARCLDELDRIPPWRWVGEVTAVVGLAIESSGPAVAIGDY